MLLATVFDGTLPLNNSVLKFLLLLAIILLVPIFLNKIRIPQLLGLIIAGAVIGPNGLNLMERDSNIVVLGTVGLLYIFLLAGLEIDLGDFKKNSKRSLVFGMFTFGIPMVLGILAGVYVLNFSMMTSVLLASMFASHTLIAYPLISRMGVAKNPAVNTAVGGTMITDTLALLVLAVVVGMTQGEVDAQFWIRLTLSLIAFGLTVMLLFPIIGRWFLKRNEDSVLQYIFILAMVFLGGILAELAGIEAIIGAFLAGLSMNRLIPHTSPLMNRVEFVGNALFIPIFLIGVGMLIDFRAFISDMETIKVAVVMVVVATIAKFSAAYATQKIYGFSLDQRRLIFGLSNAQAAATLAAVLVGYNVILGETAAGEPIRLLSESVLNGTIVMILVTCTMASFVAQKGAANIALKEATEPSIDEDGESKVFNERILIPLDDPALTEKLVDLGVTIQSKKSDDGLYAVSIVDNNADSEASEAQAKKMLHSAVVSASATDTEVTELLRYDLSSVNGITSVIKEHQITDLILGLNPEKSISAAFLVNLSKGILAKSNTTTLVYKPTQPFGTIKRHIIIVPEHAEKETGFAFWLVKMWNIAKNSGSKLVFYGHQDTLTFIKEVHKKHPVEATFSEFSDWDDFLILARNFDSDDNLIIVLSRKNRPSYQKNMVKIPLYLNKYFKDMSFILVYPMQMGFDDSSGDGVTNAGLVESIEKLDDIGSTLANIFSRKPPNG